MPDFQIIPASQYTADNDDWSNPVTASNVTSPATVTGLTNGTAYRAREIIGGPASAEFTPVAPSSMSATLIGHYADAANTTTPTFTADLASLENTDRLLLVIGTNGNTIPTSVTVGGETLGAGIVNNADGPTGARLHVYEYTADGTEGAAESVVVTYTETEASNILTLIRVAGAAIDVSAIGTTTSPAANAAVPVTPSANPNLVIAVAQGREDFFGGHAFVNVTQSGALFTGASRSAAAAFATDVGTSEYTVEFDPDPTGLGTSEAALAVIVYT